MARTHPPCPGRPGPAGRHPQDGLVTVGRGTLTPPGAVPRHARERPVTGRCTATVSPPSGDSASSRRSAWWPPSRPRPEDAMPCSNGEHRLQELFGTTLRARAFYEHQVLDHLNERMQEFVGRMEMVFLATADAGGEADCSFRAGPPGFVGVLDEGTLALPEYRGNGVMGSLGNIAENGHVGLLFVDFCGDGVGLHVNGRASIVPGELLRSDERRVGK